MLSVSLQIRLPRLLSPSGANDALDLPSSMFTGMDEPLNLSMTVTLNFGLQSLIPARSTSDQHAAHWALD